MICWGGGGGGQCSQILDNGRIGRGYMLRIKHKGIGIIHMMKGSYVIAQT